ncbi:MAG: lipid A phosphoethanolamine transferase, partial [Muribaculaceae bacterium]|nr:lipid A phosphoethanolamine transferase [Muribaculaceae bacterium]
TLAVIIVPNVMLCVTERMNWLECLANVLMPLGLYMILLSLFKKTGWGVWILLPVFALCAFQIVIVFLYGGSIIAVDMFLNVVTTNVSEATELLGNLGSAMILVVLLYVPVLVYATVTIVRKRTLGKRLKKVLLSIGILCTGISALFVIVCYRNIDGYSLTRDVFPVNVINNIRIAVERTKEVERYPETSADFSYGALSTHDDGRETYVLVIGETSRTGNWQLGGYTRNTNPKLSRRNNLTFYRRALSESNTTHKSVPMLMSHITAENFDSIKNVKSILTAFKEAGFKTTFVSNQAPNHSYTQYFGEEADECIYLPGEEATEHHPYDSEMVEYVKKSLNDICILKNFYVLHSYGSHFKYAERYPAETGSFKPDECKDVSMEMRKYLVNAYDNSIEYTDFWINQLMTVLDEAGGCCGLVYASDHGEDILDDDRERFLHASPTPTYYQLHVAMLTWVNDNHAAEYPEKIANMKEHSDLFVSSTATVFDTMLDIAGVKTDVSRDDRSLASRDYHAGSVLYLDDMNEGVDITECGLKAEDFIKLHRLVF